VLQRDKKTKNRDRKRYRVARCHRLTRECVAERRKRQEPGAESKMSYDDVEIEDMEWNDEIQAFTYPCPCGDLFQITKEDLKIGEEIARCPSCSLYITVIYNLEDFQDPPPPPQKTEQTKGTTTLIAVAWVPKFLSLGGESVAIQAWTRIGGVEWVQI
jgi:diphthamide biosynthesis protein 3